MIDPSLPPLPPDELLLVRAEQTNVRAPSEARERVLGRLAAALPALGLAADAPPSPAPPSPPPTPPAPPPPLPAASLGGSITGAAAQLSAVKLLAVAVVAGAMGAGGHALLAPQPERVVYMDRPAASAPAAASTPSPPPVAEAVPTASAAPTAPRATATASAVLDRASSLAAERALLDVARSEIMRGNPEGALAPLEAHRARFPRGDLSEEREALAIKALARLGRGDEARARAAAFRQKFPQSLLLDGVDSDLRKNP